MGSRRGRVRAWRTRWLPAAPRLEAAAAAGTDDRVLVQSVADALDAAPRPGAPVTVTAAQVVQLVAIAGEPPPSSDRPTSHWPPTQSPTTPSSAASCPPFPPAR